MSETISLYTEKVTVEPDGNQAIVTINNVEADGIVCEFKTGDLLQAIADNHGIATIHDWLSEKMKEDE